MAAGAWLIYNKAIKKIGNGTIDLSATTFRLALFGSGGNYATSTLSLLGSATDQVTSGNGYSSSGKACTSEIWTAGSSAGAYKFDVDDLVWTATGGAINSIKAAIIYTSGASAGACHVLCWSQLTSSAFNLGSGSTLTLTINASGVFELANA